jgi:RNA-directed DNA polymerase
VNVDEMQKELSRKAAREPGHQFENLYDLLWNDAWLRAAWGHVSTNAGSETAGVDHESMTTFNEPPAEKLATLREQRKAKSFAPMPVRRVYIPKATGKKRPLGIPMCHAYCISFLRRLGIASATPTLLHTLSAFT